MRLVLISDTHNLHKRLTIPEGDVVIHCGDATGTGEFREIASFLCWFDALPHMQKILVAGNHDFIFERDHDISKMLLSEHPGITYLEDSGCKIGRLRFWGSPWQPWFNNWAFNLPRNGERIREKWNGIPMDTDVLVTHGPPHGVLDQVAPGGEHLGCEELAIRIHAVRPKVHCFGHIHGGAGCIKHNETVFINASICNEDYDPINPPTVFDI
jgi:Icc-related predicted phosphoesterase